VADHANGGRRSADPSIAGARPDTKGRIDPEFSWDSRQTKVVAHVRKDKAGKRYREHQLTVMGLAAVLERPESLRSTEMIASKFEYVLPLILSNWPYFKERGLDRRAGCMLQRATRSMMEGYRFVGEYWSLEEDMDKDIFLRKFFLEMFRDRRSATTAAWLRAIRERAELREAALSNYEYEFRRAILLVRHLRRILRILRRKSEPDWESISRKAED